MKTVPTQKWGSLLSLLLLIITMAGAPNNAFGQCANDIERTKLAGLMGDFTQELNEAASALAEIDAVLNDNNAPQEAKNIATQAKPAVELAVVTAQLALLALAQDYAAVPPCTCNNQPTQGQPTQGQPTQGQPTQGQPTQGQPTQGQPTQYQPTQYQPTQDQPTQGQPTQYQPTQGQPTQ